jgi:hypothetical protein
MTVQTDAGKRELSKADRKRCDATVCELGGQTVVDLPADVTQETQVKSLIRAT